MISQMDPKISQNNSQEKHGIIPIRDDLVQPEPTPEGTRRLLRMGHSWAITLPPQWTRNWLDTSTPFVSWSINQGGCLVVRPSPHHLQPQNYA